MKTQMKVLFCFLTAFALSACSSTLSRTIIIKDMEFSLLGGLLFLVLLGAALFFIFVWPPHKPGKRDQQQEGKS